MRNIEILKGKSQRVIGIIFLTFSMFTIMAIPRFEKVFSEMFEGEKINSFTVFLLTTNPFLFLILCYIPGALLILSDKKELNTPSIKAFCILYLAMLICILIVGLFLPLIITVRKMG